MTLCHDIPERLKVIARGGNNCVSTQQSENYSVLLEENQRGASFITPSLKPKLNEKS